MNLYIIIDILLVTIISFVTYYSYKRGSYKQILEYFKIFIIVTLSTTFAKKSGLLLKKSYLITPDSNSILMLIGFLLNLVIFYYLFKYYLVLSNKFISNKKAKEYLSKMITFIQVSIISTFALFIMMQITPAKKYIYPHMNKSYSYPYIKRFYLRFLNDDFISTLFSSDTGTNHKELIFKSFKNSLQ